jgi:hypothetical protein
VEVFDLYWDFDLYSLFGPIRMAVGIKRGEFRDDESLPVLQTGD